MPETELYDPIKAYLMAQGYEVKGEVGAADLVACRGDEPPVIVDQRSHVVQLVGCCNAVDRGVV